MELWQKVNDVKKETGHLNISDTALRKIKKYCGKIMSFRHYRKIKKK